MKKSKKPKLMEAVGGGLKPKEMKKIFGARCVCSNGSADFYDQGDIVCQCSHGSVNCIANAKIAAT